MERYVLYFDEIDKTQGAIVGGKGANLGELSHVDGVRVPPGFCVTTAAFRRIVSDAPAVNAKLDLLSQLSSDDRGAIGAHTAEVRRAIEDMALPDDVVDAVRSAITRLGSDKPYAVRSSATAEDLPTASFAGQHDTYLNVVGVESIVEHVRRCWASLFSERAVTYRLRNGIDGKKIGMAVVIQQMVLPRAAGILFTADPITGNRKVSAVEAIFGLGETLVSGLTNADVYKVRDRAIIERAIATKELAIYASPNGGTHRSSISAEQQTEPALTDAQVIRLAELGRRIASHFGRPQDIEWCLVDDDFLIVQSRPITTLFPIPETGDGENHVYVSVGHQQMMTDPMKPLGISFWQMTTPRPMGVAAGRLFVDVTAALARPASRNSMLELFAKTDPLITDALRSVVDRGDFIPSLPDDDGPVWTPPGGGAPSPIATDPAIVDDLIARSEESIDAAKRDAHSKSGDAVFEFVLSDLKAMKQLQGDPRSMQVVMAGMEAAWWLNEHLHSWLGEKHTASVLSQSVPHNITSEMGLALLDVADAIRPHPNVVAFLERVDDDDFLNVLPSLAGGREARDAILAWLDKYGMRCVGEIDITRPRWSEHPRMLLPLLLGNIKNFEHGAGKSRFELGRQEALAKEEELLTRLRALPDGEQKAEETKRMIDRLRMFAGYREYPKYRMISRYFIYKQALLKEAERLVRARVLREKEDAFYLTFDEFREAVRTNRVDDALIRDRRGEYQSYLALTPPRVLTSDGDALTGSYRRDDFPEGALVGLPVSAGVVEGRARVILDIADAEVEPGDIVVTAYTDPSWTPLFVAISGVVTEVGGLMTHGAVIAREYGLPAVVGVEHATQRIRDGQRIRLHGTEGYIEIL